MKIGGKLFSLITKPLSLLTRPLMGLMNMALGMVPFGNLLRPILNQFLSNPLSLLTGGGLGALGSLLGAATNPRQLLQTVMGLHGQMGGPMALPPEAAVNLMQMVAMNHARMMRF